MRKLIVLFMWALCCSLSSMAQTNKSVPVKAGIVLDLSSPAARMGLSCINMSLSDFYASHFHYNTRLVFIVRDSHSDVVSAASQALDLMKTEKVQAIIGPFTSMEAIFLISLGGKAHVPIITFSATSPSLASLPSSYFFRIAQTDSAQVNAIGAIVQAFGWKEAVPIYTDNEYGKGVIPFLTNSLQQVYVRIPYQSSISASATDEDIRAELYKLMTMQTRVFVVHMTPNPGVRLFTIAKQIGMMSKGYVWIVTDGLANGLSSLNSSVIESMEGVLGVRTYIPKTKQLDEFNVRWKRRFLQDNPTLVHTDLNVFGVWAYDAVTALAMAIEKVDTNNLGFAMTNATSSNSTDLERIGVSKSGQKLREALSNTTFTGLSGEFSIVNRQLQASTFEILNVIGNGGRTIGFWTPQNGIVRNLNSTKTKMYSTSSKDLGTIIWPGDTNSVPKGWEIPTNARKLRIGVPEKNGYPQFVKVSYDPITNTTDVTGFCIDVFKAVLEVLPYALPYEFIPFTKPNGDSAGSYNELISQVYFGNFDAVVGDVTIIANRSNYVDFTLPYTESGVTMVVPVKDEREKNAWAFLKPLTWDLWVTIACSFLFIGFVVWALEHRINEHFRGPLSHQIGTSLWFSFSTMVFAHREKVVSNLGRFVVIIWVFVVLILVQSYTASLTALLTVDQLNPTVTDVNLLIKNGMNVGYKQGSFVLEILKEMGFLDYQLKTYKSPEECNELFERGNANGGIAAAFDELPYVVKVFLQSYCSKYAMLEPTFKTGGFGFVFPKGSPLVADISRAILNVTQGDKMKVIENAWFRKNNCPGSNTSISSNILGLESFWGLFLIVGITSALALTVYAVNFLYQHKQIWLHNDPNTSQWKRIRKLIDKFDQRDMNSHTFRKREMQNNSEDYSRHDICEFEASPRTNCSPNSSESESSFSFCSEASPNRPAPQDK
ncbi:hypothetical protein QN277_015288 [Acacia crassicarpa]|uniref:Glutamate receptor n=1 Tax=Acacia crassicarpa TaxID=499986 RepID=A0AAE1MTY8_9FABA|nr:hypothetical protein QN277_015288 [Acacia crassicarpa]